MVKSMLGCFLGEKNNMWIGEWPTEPGWYWFYGFDFKPKFKDEVPRLHMVHAIRISNGMAYICDGHFIYKSEAGKGFFHPADPPNTFMLRDKFL